MSSGDLWMTPVPALDTQPMVALPSFPVRLRFENVHVDFPTANGPMIETNSPFWISKLTSSITFIGPAAVGNSTETCSKRIRTGWTSSIERAAMMSTFAMVK